MNKRITLFVGEFGSGKTEMAINYALYLKRQGTQVAIADMDLIKPLFRTRENVKLFEEHGIKAIVPETRFAHADLPVMPLELTKILEDNSYQVVIDAGGGETAIALGQLRHKLIKAGAEVWMVVNTYRPFTSTVEGIVAVMEKIETVSGLSVTGLVANSNLGVETTEDHIRKGYHTVLEVASIRKLPLQFVAVPPWITLRCSFAAPIFVLQPQTIYPWME